MERDDGYIQVGVTALRGPDGKFCQAVPLFIRADEAAVAGEEKLIEDIGHLLALRMKEYMDGCRAAGVSV